MGVTIVTFFCTAAVAAIIMYIIVRLIPIVPQGFEAVETAEATEIDVPTLIVNFFTKPDFIELFSRRAILPLIVAAILFGFGVQLNGGRETMTAKILADVNACLMKTMRIITYYAPIGFFGFFAYLVATYGPSLIGAYGKTIIIYYVVAFAYMFIFAAARAPRRSCSAICLHRRRWPSAPARPLRRSRRTWRPARIPASPRMGATMHMDGSAMSAIIKVAFLFGIFGQDFSTGRAILAIIVAVFSSVAMSGIPGGGGTGEMVLCSIFFPEQIGIALPIADGERGDGLCLDLHRVEVCGRQGLAAEAA